MLVRIPTTLVFAKNKDADAHVFAPPRLFDSQAKRGPVAPKRRSSARLAFEGTRGPSQTQTGAGSPGLLYQSAASYISEREHSLELIRGARARVCVRTCVRAKGWLGVRISAFRASDEIPMTNARTIEAWKTSRRFGGLSAGTQ